MTPAIFNTQIPDPAVPHTFSQPIDCLIPKPRPGDTNRASETSGWVEGVPAPLCKLMPGANRRSGECSTTSVHCQPSENLLLPPPVRHESEPRSSSCKWWISANARNHQPQLNSVQHARVKQCTEDETHGARGNAADTRAAMATKPRAHACVASPTNESMNSDEKNPDSITKSNQTITSLTCSRMRDVASTMVVT